MTVLVDSDILIEVSRGTDEVILAKWDALGESDHIVMCSPVSVAELWHGARPREHKQLRNLFRRLFCTSIDASVGELAGEFLRAYRKSHAVQLGDALIAATAVQHQAALWTRNRKHYPMERVIFYEP